MIYIDRKSGTVLSTWDRRKIENEAKKNKILSSKNLATSFNEDDFEQVNIYFSTHYVLRKFSHEEGEWDFAYLTMSGRRKLRKHIENGWELVSSPGADIKEQFLYKQKQIIVKKKVKQPITKRTVSKETADFAQRMAKLFLY